MINNSRNTRQSPSKRVQLGFSANSPIGAAIVDGLFVFTEKVPGRDELVAWCISNNLIGSELAKLIRNIYDDVNQSYFFWADMLDIMYSYDTLSLEDLTFKLNLAQAKKKDPSWNIDSESLLG